jgi:hypothetical protein
MYTYPLVGEAGGGADDADEVVDGVVAEAKVLRGDGVWRAATPSRPKTVDLGRGRKGDLARWDP